MGSKKHIMIKSAKRKIKNFKKAVKYLDKCGDFDFDKYKKAHNIAKTEAQESELREMWSGARYVLPGPGQPGGVESLRQLTRDSFITATAKVQALLSKMKNI